jgi:hypothetical protein
MGNHPRIPYFDRFRKIGKLAHVQKPHESNGRELSTPSEVAKALKISPPTVMALFRKGIIEAEIAIGRIYRFNLNKCLTALRKHSEEKGGARE